MISGWKLETCPIFEKSQKIAENRRFRQNGWPKSKTNTGNGFLGVDYIYLATSFVILLCIAWKSPNFYENRRFCQKIADFRQFFVIFQNGGSPPVFHLKSPNRAYNLLFIYILGFTDVSAIFFTISAIFFTKSSVFVNVRRFFGYSWKNNKLGV